MDIFYKIRHCPDFQSLYALEEDFNKVGLTLQATQKNRMILCKIESGKPKAHKIIEDYIFCGSIQEASNSLNDYIVERIVDFVGNSKGAPAKVENIAKAWRNGVRMYGETLCVVNEDIEFIADNMLLE